MKSINFANASALIVVAGLVAALISNQEKETQQETPAKTVTEKTTAAEEAKPETEAPSFESIDNMHHFMEYICEPSYKSLKEIMVKEPENRKQWKAFKNHSLVLAETTALLAQRCPKEDEESSAQWNQLSFSVYNSGKQLYKSAGKFDDAKLHYSAMIDNCNKCHTAFADGKYQLEK